MGHARYNDLRGLEKVLDEIRKLPGIAEPTPGIFYLRRVPFLHFHTKDGMRWAEVPHPPDTRWASGVPMQDRNASLPSCGYPRQLGGRFSDR